MQRGCVSLGNMQCDDCHRVIQHAERYLIMEEAGSAKLSLCVDCSLDKGYAHYKEEKGERMLTFLSEELGNAR